MRLIRRIAGSSAAPRFEIVDDDFAHVSDDDQLPTAPMLVTCERFEREREAILATGLRVGIRVSGSCDTDKLLPTLPTVALIAVEFPSFTDGRGYSVARRLREQCGYEGRLRAYGNVLRDQLGYMHRVGFDEFELDPTKDIEDALAAFDELTVKYQPAADERLPLWKRASRSWPPSVPARK